MKSVHTGTDITRRFRSCERCLTDAQPRRREARIARAVDDGGLVIEDKMPRTLAEALAALERGLKE